MANDQSWHYLTLVTGDTVYKEYILEEVAPWSGLLCPHDFFISQIDYYFARAGHAPGPHHEMNNGQTTEGHPEGHPYLGHPQGHPNQGHPNQGHPDLGHPDVGYPGLGHPGLGHPDLDHPDLGYPGLDHPGLGHPDLGHPLGHPDLGYPGLGHPDQGHPDFAQDHPNIDEHMRGHEMEQDVTLGHAFPFGKIEGNKADGEVPNMPVHEVDGLPTKEPLEKVLPQGDSLAAITMSTQKYSLYVFDALHFARRQEYRENKRYADDVTIKLDVKFNGSKMDLTNIHNLLRSGKYLKEGKIPRSYGPCASLIYCVGHQVCMFRFSNEFCHSDPMPGVRKSLNLRLRCDRKFAYNDLLRQYATLAGVGFEVGTSMAHWPNAAVYVKYKSQLGQGIRSYNATLTPKLTHIKDVFGMHCPPTFMAREEGYVLFKQFNIYFTKFG